MRAALRRTAEPILASGGTVVLGVLTLLLSEQETNRALGVACATGVVFAMLFGAVRAPRRAGALRSRPVLAVRAPGRRPGPRGRGSGAGSAPPWPPPGRSSRRGRLLLAGLALGWARHPHRPVRDRTVPGRARGGRRRETLARPSPPATQPVACSPPRRRSRGHRAAAAVPGVASARPGDAGAPSPRSTWSWTPNPDTAGPGDRGARATPRGRLRRRPPPAPTPRRGRSSVAPWPTYDSDEANDRDLRLILPIILLLVGAVLVPAAARPARPAAAGAHRDRVVLRQPRRGLAALRPRAGLPRAGQRRAAARLRVPGGPRGGLQHLPGHPGPGGAGARAPATACSPPCGSPAA